MELNSQQQGLWDRLTDLNECFRTKENPEPLIRVSKMFAEEVITSGLATIKGIKYGTTEDDVLNGFMRLKLTKDSLILQG